MLKSLHRLFLAVLLLAAWPALAQTDPPSRVGRLSHLEGEVGFKVDHNDQGGSATLNWPVSSGAILDSGRSGRAEIWIGSTAYRLNRDSAVEYPVVDDRRVDVRLTGGSLAVTVLDRDQADDVEVMTPDGNVRFLTPGRYRINVHAERSELLVQAGRATFDNGRRTIPVAAGQMAVLSSDGGERLEAARAYDGFDQWVAQRENATLGDTARRHVSPHMTGYQDLDAYGDWRTTSDYGSVWYPQGVASDWAPYRQGRWAWVAPWGWTWIDQAPWGFAPFHYGRWAFIAGRWGWVPGRSVARPVYAPALVGWVGNPGWSASFSFGSAPAVGWFPLAPREVYVPAYRYSPTYVRQVNITHVTNVTQIERVVRGAPPAYVHHASPQAVTVVPTRQMQEGRPISASEIRHHEYRDLDRAPLARQAPSTQWVAPAPAAARPSDGQRPAGREFEAQRMPGAERGAFRETGRGDRPRGPEGGPLPGDGRARQPAENAASSPRQQDSSAPVQQGRPAATESANEARREFFRRQQEARQDNPGSLPDPRRDERSPSAWPSQRREQRGELPRQAPQPGNPGSPPVAAPQPLAHPPEATSAPAPLRREMPASEMRREERQQPAFPQQDREPRREMREMPRQERQSQPPAGIAAPREATSAPPSFRREMPSPDTPREMPRMERPTAAQPAPLISPQAMPPREQPRPAPEVRMPAPQPAAPPPPRAEPPRQQPATQGGNEGHRRRDEERGQR